MELPLELKEELEKEIQSASIKELKQCAQKVSERYREDSKIKTKNKLINSKEEALAYAISRMPATYGSIHTALENTIKIANIDIQSVLDIGAGTGSAEWAILDLMQVDDITCIENETYMMQMGKRLMQNNETLKNAKWMKLNIAQEQIDQKADLVIASYVLNEIEEKTREQILEKLWQATNKILLIIEPGTPEGYKEINSIRKYFIGNKVNIVAPCQHNGECKIGHDDWCAFSCRVARSKAHKILKDGEIPYEDEKFSYIAISKFETEKLDGVVLRHPKIESGKITIKVCKSNGEIEEKIITKKEKEIFKKAKKLKAGDIINL